MKRKRYSLTKEVMQEALTLRLHGFRNQEIATRYDVTEVGLYAAVHRHGLREDWIQVYSLYKFNISRRAVYIRAQGHNLDYILKKLEIPNKDTLVRMIKDSGKWDAWTKARKNVRYKKRIDATNLPLGIVLHYRGELGLSYSKIGEMLGQSESVIRYYCRRNNIQKPNISEAKANRQKWGNKNILS